MRYYYLKHRMSCLQDQKFEVDIDRECREVHVRVDTVDTVDTSLLAALVRDILPAEHGVVAYRDDNKKYGDAWLTEPADFQLVVDFGGTLYRTEVVELFGSKDGQREFAVVLEDPALERRRRCLETAAEVLRALHERGIEARVVGSVARDGPWHPGTDVDVMVMNRDAPTFAVGHPDVDAAVSSRTWRVPLDIFYASWWETLSADPYLLWSASERRCVLVEPKSQQQALQQMADDAQQLGLGY